MESGRGSIKPNHTQTNVVYMLQDDSLYKKERRKCSETMQENVDPHENTGIRNKQFFNNRYLVVLLALFCGTLTVMIISLDEMRKDSVHLPQDTPDHVSLANGNIPVILKWFNLAGNVNHNITCKSLRCHVTDHAEVIHQYDIMGIMFNGVHFGSHGFPLPRKPDHLWSVIHDESPKFNYFLFTAEGTMDLFNLTSTFNRESHYPIPTMFLRDEKDLTSTEFLVPVQEKNQLRKEGLAPIVFVQTDCNTPSDRSHYMRLLNRYIQIDSYGPCEHNKEFPNSDFLFKNGMGAMRTKNFSRFIAQYKFTFAFENAVCDDYITEKFWRPLHLGVVPLVFGSPKIRDFAPTDHSIIDIRDFSSVKDVANYITFLDTHDEEYLKYLDFKRTGITNPELRSQIDRRNWGPGKTYLSFVRGFECFVCEKLHKLKDQMISGQPVTHWQGKREHYTCPEPKSFDEEGRYVEKNIQWLKIYQSAKYYLQAIRYHFVNNIHPNGRDIHKFAAELQRFERNKGVST